MTLTITGTGKRWYVCDAANGLIKSEHSSQADAQAALGIRPPAAPAAATGCYQISHGITSDNIRIYTAEYVTHAGEVRYMMHSAVIDPVVALINKLTKAA